MSGIIHFMDKERDKRLRSASALTSDVKGMKETFPAHPHKDKRGLIHPEGGSHMDEVTKTILDRLDKDVREHRQEVREREARILADAQEREKRYREELLEQQRFFREEAKEREERMLNSVQELKDDFRTTKNTVIALTISVILGVSSMVLAIVLTK